MKFLSIKWRQFILIIFKVGGTAVTGLQAKPMQPLPIVIIAYFYILNFCVVFGAFNNRHYEGENTIGRIDMRAVAIRSASENVLPALSIQPVYIGLIVQSIPPAEDKT